MIFRNGTINHFRLRFSSVLLNRACVDYVSKIRTDRLGISLKSNKVSVITNLSGFIKINDFFRRPWQKMEFYWDIDRKTKKFGRHLFFTIFFLHVIDCGKVSSIKLVKSVQTYNFVLLLAVFDKNYILQSTVKLTTTRPPLHIHSVAWTSTTFRNIPGSCLQIETINLICKKYVNTGNNT